MKRMIVWILALVLAVSATGAFAEDTGTAGAAVQEQQEVQPAPSAQARGRRQQQGQLPGESSRNKGGKKRTGVPGQPGGAAPAEGQAKGGSGAAGGQRSQKQGKKSSSATAAIDFDALLAQGVISQETRDRIKAYMDARDSAGTSDANAAEDSTDTTAGATKKGGQQTKKQKKATAQNASLLIELLQANIITQAEFDAITAIQNGTGVSGSST